MSTGKRLAKRSIVGTRVCAPGEDGLFYSGVIQSVKTPLEQNDYESNMDTVYSVRFDFASKKCPSVKREFYGSEIIGPGFQPLSNFRLLPGQKIFLTYNGREISGHIVHHDTLVDEVTVSINPPGHEVSDSIIISFIQFDFYCDTQTFSLSCPFFFLPLSKRFLCSKFKKISL